jgi:hypothetical protein
MFAAVLLLNEHDGFVPVIKSEKTSLDQERKTYKSIMTSPLKL